MTSSKVNAHGTLSVGVDGETGVADESSRRCQIEE